MSAEFSPTLFALSFLSANDPSTCVQTVGTRLWHKLVAKLVIAPIMTESPLFTYRLLICVVAILVITLKKKNGSVLKQGRCFVRG